MRRLPASIVIAIAAHLALAGWLATRRDTAVTPHTAATTAVVVAPPPPIEIALVTFEDVPTTTAEAPRVAHRAQVSPVAIAHPSHATVVDAPVEAPAEPVPATSGTPRPLDLSLRNRDALDHVPAGTTAQPAAPAPPTRAELEDSTETETFAIDVARDGTAHVHDKRNFHFNLPSKGKVGDWLESGHDARLLPGDGEPTATVPSIGATIAKFDITDFAMRVYGDDPYAAEKLRALDATRDRRVEIGAKHEHQRLAGAGWLVQSNLDHLWESIHDPAARKRALFEIWDECAESGSQDLVQAGASARARVVVVIRAKLPAGSPDAFTEAELVAFNREKQSHALFAPYRD